MVRAWVWAKWDCLKISTLRLSFITGLSSSQRSAYSIALLPAMSFWTAGGAHGWLGWVTPFQRHRLNHIAHCGYKSKERQWRPRCSRLPSVPDLEERLSGLLRYPWIWLTFSLEKEATIFHWYKENEIQYELWKRLDMTVFVSNSGGGCFAPYSAKWPMKPRVQIPLCQFHFNINKGCGDTFLCFCA